MEFVFPTNVTPQQVIEGLKAEVIRRKSIVQSAMVGATKVKDSVRLSGELTAYSNIEWVLERVVFRD